MRTYRGDNRYANFQFYSRSVLPIVTNFLASLIRLLTLQAVVELRYGMAPPSSCERALNKLLADMGESDNDF